MGKFTLHNSRNVLWAVCKPSVILCVLLILAEVFLVEKEPDYLCLIRTFHIVLKPLRHCQTITADYFFEKLTSAILVSVAAKFTYIDCKLCDKGWNIQLIPILGSSSIFSVDFPGILLWEGNQIVFREHWAATVIYLFCWLAQIIMI